MRAGDRVAIALPPGIHFVRALHSCLLLGAVAVPVDLRHSERERAQITAGAAAVVSAPLGEPAPGAARDPIWQAVRHALARRP